MTDQLTDWCLFIFETKICKARGKLCKQWIRSNNTQLGRGGLQGVVGYERGVGRTARALVSAI